MNSSNFFGTNPWKISIIKENNNDFLKYLSNGYLRINGFLSFKKIQLIQNSENSKLKYYDSFCEISGFKVFLNGELLNFEEETLYDYESYLDLKSGILSISFLIKKQNEEYKFEIQKFLSLENKHLFIFNLKIDTFQSAANFLIIPYLKLCKDDEKSKSDVKENIGYISYSKSEYDNLTFMHQMYVSVNKFNKVSFFKNNSYIENSFSIDLESNDSCSLSKYVLTSTSFDTNIGSLYSFTNNMMIKEKKLSFIKQKEKHEKYYLKLWNFYDFQVKNHLLSQQNIRLKIFLFFSYYSQTQLKDLTYLTGGCLNRMTPDEIYDFANNFESINIEQPFLDFIPNLIINTLCLDKKENSIYIYPNFPKEWIGFTTNVVLSRDLFKINVKKDRILLKLLSENAIYINLNEKNYLLKDQLSIAVE